MDFQYTIYWFSEPYCNLKLEFCDVLDYRFVSEQSEIKAYGFQSYLVGHNHIYRISRSYMITQDGESLKQAKLEVQFA